ncbi:DUF1285 domain-containing protein [Terasakiella sp. A23]|uniref:DUF1285 domain-containing protein n=1 Tax=Terasakiella sp. FCG-A23 TaxID=3080561 RepID=UPI0029549A36|nr:DUF1285 domain-containing protein [Terasakiella sp. A23]MDV7338418.1 DUF1285 domain-containing protein [Terasakiella sp. A23]
MNTAMAQPSAPTIEPMCGDIDIRIAKDGTWFHEGGPIGRKELVCLFASVLKRDEFGEYWLQTPVEKARIEVEDAPFVAVELFINDCGADQKLSVRTNIDEVVSIGLDNPIRVEHDPVTDEPSPYVTLRAGKGMFPIEAKINRAVFYELVSRGVEETIDNEVFFGVWSNNEFFPLGQLDDD